MRTRSEYRLTPVPRTPVASSLDVVHPDDSHREELSVLMLDSYRGTIDDEGEDLDDAHEAIAHYLAAIERSHSFVVLEQGTVVAFSFVLVVNGVHYVDPVVVAPARKQRGVGRAAVELCMGSLADAGVSEVGATITDGNIASECLFASLGFTRRGVWG